MPSPIRQRNGRYGAPKGYLEHEITAWIRSRVRAGGPALPPLPVPDHPRIISVAEVSERTGYSRTHLWRKERDDPNFPKRVTLSTSAPEAAD